MHIAALEVPRWTEILKMLDRFQVEGLPKVKLTADLAHVGIIEIPFKFFQNIFQI